MTASSAYFNDVFQRSSLNMYQTVISSNSYNNSCLTFKDFHQCKILQMHVLYLSFRCLLIADYTVLALLIVEGRTLIYDC